MVWKLRQPQHAPDLFSGFHFQINEEANCLFVQHQCDVNSEILSQRANYLRQLPEHRPNLDRVIDMRGADIEMTLEELKAFVADIQAAKTLIGSHRHAMILEDRLDHNMIKCLTGTFSNLVVEFTYFDANDPALEQNLKQWLNLKPDFQFPEFLQPMTDA